MGVDSPLPIPPKEVNAMNSIKCPNCSLTNFATDDACRRCGTPFLQDAQNAKRTRQFPFAFVILIAIIGSFLYYAYYGMQDSVSKINANDANRVAGQANDKTAGLSRTEYDKQRSGQYGNAIKNNPSFEAQKKHNEETQKMMQAASNGR